MTYNPFNRFTRLRNKAAGLDTEGLASRLAKFTTTDPSTDPAPPVKIQTAPPADPVPDPAKTETVVPDPVLEVEDEFPEVGKIPAAAAAKEFDEAAFDKATEDEAKGMEGKQGEKFRALKAELKAFKQQEFKPDLSKNAEHAALLKEVETLRVTAQEVEGLRQRNERLTKVTDELAVRESQEFTTKVTQPLKDMKAAITSLATAAGVDGQVLQDIIAESDPGKQDQMITQVENKLGRRSTSRLERLCDDYRVIGQEESRMLSNAPQTLAAARAQEQKQADDDRAALTGQFQAATKESFLKYGKLIPGFRDSSDKGTDLADSVESQAVSIDPHSLTPGDLAFMMFASKALPILRKEFVKLQNEVKTLRGEAPAPAIPGGAAPKTTKTEEKEGSTLAERMRGKQFTFDPAKV